MKAAILQALKNAAESNLNELSLKKLRKLTSECFHANGETEDKKWRIEFGEVLTTLEGQGKIVNQDGLYSKKRKSKELKEETNTDDVVQKKQKNTSEVVTTSADDEPELVKKAGSAPVSYSASSAKAKMDLSKFGEQAWRDGTLDQDYLSSNPDGITRLFCGNLNKKITEEELKACLDGVTHIKWITDKQTREFYGSTFVEMKDSKAAATAVMKDKSKFMGR